MGRKRTFSGVVFTKRKVRNKNVVKNQPTTTSTTCIENELNSADFIPFVKNHGDPAQRKSKKKRKNAKALNWQISCELRIYAQRHSHITTY